MKRICVFLLACALQCIGSVAGAADGVSAVLQAYKVVATADGVRYTPTTQALPGDTIEYRTTYRNNGSTAMRELLATLPVPDGGMRYLPGSAAPAAVQASTDGIHFAPAPLTRSVVRNGRRELEAVPVSEYRFLRWKLGELAPGASITVISRMRLDGASNNDRS